MTAVIISGGVELLIAMPPKDPSKPSTIIDIEADRVVIWTKGNGPQAFDNMKKPQGDESGAHEVYLAGHVELRLRTEKTVETLPPTWSITTSPQRRRGPEGRFRNGHAQGLDADPLHDGRIKAARSGLA